MIKLVLLCALVGLAAAAPAYDHSFEFDDDDFPGAGRGQGATVYSGIPPSLTSTRKIFLGEAESHEAFDDDDNIGFRYAGHPSVGVSGQSVPGATVYSGVPSTVIHPTSSRKVFYSAGSHEAFDDDDDNIGFRYVGHPSVGVSGQAVSGATVYSGVPSTVIHPTSSRKVFYKAESHEAFDDDDNIGFRYVGHPSVGVSGQSVSGATVYSGVPSTVIHPTSSRKVFYKAESHEAFDDDDNIGFRYVGHPSVGVSGQSVSGVQTYGVAPSVGSVAIHGVPQVSSVNVAPQSTVYSSPVAAARPVAAAYHAVSAQPQAVFHSVQQPSVVSSVVSPSVFRSSFVPQAAGISYHSSGTPVFRSGVVASLPTQFYRASVSPPTFYAAPARQGTVYINVDQDLDDHDRFDFD